MNPLIIFAILALLLALVEIRALEAKLKTAISDCDCMAKQMQDRGNRLTVVEKKLSNAVTALTACQLNNADLITELKRKHRRVPKL